MKVSKDRPINKVASKSQIDNVIRTVKSMMGLDNDYHKVFAIGFNKTATTSLYSFFRSLGLEAMDGPHWKKNDDWHIHYQFQTFSDGPPEDFKYLDGKFPNSKFILNVRNLDEWLDSRVEHIRFRLKDPAYQKKPGGRAVPDMNGLTKWIKNRDKHHLNVLRHFKERPQDLLVVNFIKDDEAVSKIARFLEFDYRGEKPYTPSFLTNRGEELVNKELISDSFKKLAIPESEWTNDIYCPSICSSGIEFPTDTSLMR